MSISGVPHPGCRGATPRPGVLICSQPLRDDQQVAKIPESTQISMRHKILARARERWPQIAEVHTHYRGGFAYVDVTLTDGDRLPLFRLRYAGSASRWGFAIYRTSHEDYQQAALPDGWPSGTPEDALDTACGLYLGDPTAWQTDPRRINRDDH